MSSTAQIEKKRLQNRLAKQRERLSKKQAGQIVDLADKKRRVIKNICDGKLIRSSLETLGITIDMIPCDHAQIHPMVLSKLLKNQQTPPIQPVLTTAMINQIFDDLLSEKKYSERTINEYKKRIKYIIEASGCTDDDFIKCVNDPHKIIEALKIKHPSSYKDDISPIITLAKYSELFKQYIAPEIIEQYRQAIKLAIKASEKKQSDKANNDTCTPWESIVKVRTKLAKNEQFSQRHVLISMYTYIPCMRDDFGNIQLLYQDVPPNNTDDFYRPKNGQLIINSYKTIGKYGSIDIIVPKQLRHIINQSIKLNPREFLITKNNNTSPKEIFSSGKGSLSNLVTTSFGFGINDMRHSLETYVHLNRHLFTHDELVLIDRIMGHNANMALSYIRTGNINPLIKPNNIYVPSPFDTNTEISLVQSICDKIGGNLM